MYTIIQGSNLPIVFNIIDEIDINSIRITLWHCKSKLKTWEKDDVDINLDDKILLVPLTQKETLRFPVGDAYIEAKWIDSEGIVHMACVNEIHICSRNDSKELEVDDHES